MASGVEVLLAVSLMVKAGTASRAITEDAEVLTSLRAANDETKSKAKSFCCPF